MSRYSTSAKNFGSTHVAFGFLIVLVSFDFGLTTVSSCFLIWLETVREGQFPMYLVTALIFSQFSFRSDRYGASARLDMMPSQFSLAACSNIF